MDPLLFGIDTETVLESPRDDRIVSLARRAIAIVLFEWRPLVDKFAQSSLKERPLS